MASYGDGRNPIEGDLIDMGAIANDGPPTFGSIAAPLPFDDRSRLEIFPQAQ